MSISPPIKHEVKVVDIPKPNIKEIKAETEQQLNQPNKDLQRAFPQPFKVLGENSLIMEASVENPGMRSEDMHLLEE